MTSGHEVKAAALASRVTKAEAKGDDSNAATDAAAVESKRSQSPEGNKSSFCDDGHQESS